ncbi:MAG: cytochrome c oxidase assembly protein, partial [Acidimicrobiales bacterium]|nr:cytochrome c oxidase assembly protein [Acidimicrobiales bacterium]
AVRVIGPKAVPAGTPVVSRRQRGWFIVGIALLWAAADWPIHDIGERYLYLVHMSQHLLLTLVVPPIMLLATPEWLARLVVGTGRVDRWVHQLARPVPAAVLFNGLVLLSHFTGTVNLASESGLFHYGMHTALVLSAVLLWIPVCGPFPELRISPPAQVVHLFLTSIIPTVPGAWLTFADGAVYRVYDIPDRLWGVSVTSDQQVAGLIMKLVGGTYLWILIAVIFFRWAGTAMREDDPTTLVQADELAPVPG